jgi:hypothetical protein
MIPNIPVGGRCPHLPPHKQEGGRVMTRECRKIEALFAKLLKQPMLQFPKERQRLEAPSEQAVYIIRKGKVVLHVGRTVSGRGGLNQRLKNHLYGSSSFTKNWLKHDGSSLRKGHTYQFLGVEDPRLRGLLEAYTIGKLCPEHFGSGE